MLESQGNPAFAASYGEALGDAYYALGRVPDAEAAYQQVLMNPLSRGTVDQQLVQWKVLDLPSVAEKAPAAEPAGDETVETTESDIVEEVAE